MPHACPAFQLSSLSHRRLRLSHRRHEHDHSICTKPSRMRTAPNHPLSSPSHFKSTTVGAGPVPIQMMSSSSTQTPPSANEGPSDRAAGTTTSPDASFSFSSLFSPAPGKDGNGGNDVVYDASGSSVSLVAHVSALNAQGKTVVVGWLRHYGCTLCMKQASDWKAWLSTSGSLSIVDDASLDLAPILIGNGPHQQITPFADRLQWPDVTLFTDPTRTTYAALEFTNKKKDLFNLPSLSATLSSFRQGHPQKWGVLPTDPFQQGGVVVVDPTGAVRLFRPDRYAGDHVDGQTLRQALILSSSSAPSSNSSPSS